MSDGRNRPDSKNQTDRWLTPPEIITALGSFDLDPACESVMPWRTSKIMVSNEMPDDRVGIPADIVSDGLTLAWAGRVWLNCPWSDPLLWALKMAVHRNGVWLSSGKSPDTQWAQIILGAADAVLFPVGRPLFHYPDGTKSSGKWTPVMFAAWGKENVSALRRLQETMPGALMARI